MSKDVRDQLADALFTALNATNPLHYDDAAEDLADALLPVVERIAREAWDGGYVVGWREALTAG